MKDREKKLIELSRKMLSVAAADTSTETVQVRATKIHLIACINHTDINVFCQQVHSKALDMESRGSDEVEVQYSTSSVVPSAGLIITTHSALLIGRKYANSEIK